MQLDNLLRHHANPEVRAKFDFLEQNKDFLSIYLECPYDGSIIDMMQSEPYYKDLLKREFQGVWSCTPISELDPILKLLDIVYNDLKSFPSECLKVIYN